MFKKKNKSQEVSDISLFSPQQTLRNKINAMFEQDKDITVSQLTKVEGGYIIEMRVNGEVKYNALDKILKTVYDLGNVTVYLQIIPANGEDEDTITGKTYEQAFTGNPIFSQIVSRPCDPYIPDDLQDFCIFANEIIQFNNDDISDFYGNYNGLPTDIAKEIFKDSSVKFSIEQK